MGKKRTIEINFHGTELEVEGMYDEGYKGDHLTEPEPPSFEILKIYVDNEETDMFDDDSLEIGILCYEAILNSDTIENDIKKFLS